jgi:hypothetical protein
LFSVLKIHRTGVDALKTSQYFRARTCGDEKAAAGTIGLNEPGMAGIELPERQLSIRTWHSAPNLNTDSKQV